MRGVSKPNKKPTHAWEGARAAVQKPRRLAARQMHRLLQGSSPSGADAERALESHAPWRRQGGAAVRAAITSPWSNGQTEDQITRLKLLERQMYGRGKIDLLQARLIGQGVSALHQTCVRAKVRSRYTASTRASAQDCCPARHFNWMAGLTRGQAVIEVHWHPAREQKSTLWRATESPDPWLAQIGLYDAFNGN